MAVTNVTSIASDQETSARLRAASGRIWKIYLAGVMRVIGPLGENALPTARKSRGLIAYLCLAPSKRASRNRLAAVLWDKSGDLARRSVRQALYDIDRLTGVLTGGLICLDDDDVCLNDDACWIDVLEEPGQYPDRLLDDLDGLSDTFDLWLSGERISFEDRVRTSLYAEVTRLQAESAPADRLTAAARKVLSFDPTHEGAVRVLMKALTDLGDHVQALREYQRCRAELRRTLDVPPSRETVRLHEAIRLVSSRSVPAVDPPRASAAVATKASGPPAERLAVGPSIAVLPFTNLSGEPQHDYTIAGLAEDLIAMLSRLPGFVVISRLSTRMFKDQADRSPQDIGDLLDVRYLLSGSLRVAGERFRLNVELSDAIRGIVLGYQEVEERFSDVLDMPLHLADEILRQVTPNLRRAELARIRAKRPELLNAYDYFIQAQENMHNFSKSVFDRAEYMFDQALMLDPNYAAALAGRAYWHVLRVGQGWSADPALDAQLASEFAARALDNDPDEPMALGIQGHIAAYLQKDFDLAFERFDAALRLNPNAAAVWVWSAAARAWEEDGVRAIEEAKRGSALSPFDPLMYFFNTIAGMAYLVDAQYERAIECGYRSLRDNRRYTAGHRVLVLGLMLAGRHDEARAAVHRLLAVEPTMTIERFRARYPGAARPHADLYCEAFAEAGVPRL